MRTLLSRSLLLAFLLSTCSATQGVYDDRPLPSKLKVDRLRIFKERHRLEAWSGKRLLKVYTVAIGRGGAGHKRHEGDGRTPEGRYLVDGRHPSRKFHLFLHISYPNAGDRAAFGKARRAGRLPPRARIGGDIGIHGEKRGWRLLPHKWFDWTRGCVALDNSEIEELYRAVKKRAAVEILP